ncbi:MAG: hypothetical protein BWX48_02438 [Verrucomicrobia bacterium ADurb.Bin006]|nr:MAG: hypothetical protein BWX48_02438 [Verrucomicrobia bacterium ADurb.Bin006]
MCSQAIRPASRSSPPRRLKRGRRASSPAGLTLPDPPECAPIGGGSNRTLHFSAPDTTPLLTELSPEPGEEDTRRVDVRDVTSRLGQIALPLRLEPCGSLFVIFRTTTDAAVRQRVVSATRDGQPIVAVASAPTLKKSPDAGPQPGAAHDQPASARHGDIVELWREGNALRLSASGPAGTYTVQHGDGHIETLFTGELRRIATAIASITIQHWSSSTSRTNQSHPLGRRPDPTPFTPLASAASAISGSSRRPLRHTPSRRLNRPCSSQPQPIT